MNTAVLPLPDGGSIPYLLERRPRRTVGMRIGSEGLLVRAPRRISHAQIEQLLLSKLDWIIAKLKAQQEVAAHAIRWRDGATLLLLGNELRLNIRHDARSRAIEHQPGLLHVALPEPTDEAAVARKVLLWYRKQALLDFSRRLELFSARLGVALPKLFLSNARGRWGSCNSKAEVRLNWRLLQAPPHIINYVICHELAHLKEMNHSRKFWAVVESLCPEYKKAEQELKAWAPRLHLIGSA